MTYRQMKQSLDHFSDAQLDSGITVEVLDNETDQVVTLEGELAIFSGRPFIDCTDSTEPLSEEEMKHLIKEVKG